MNKKQLGVLRIGTSGIVVPGNQSSYPAALQGRSRLHYYSTLYNTLEVNSSFKKIPMLRTLEKWVGDVVDDFQFTLKLWREITHVKELNIDFDNIDQFINTAAGIGMKKGCLLVQFPGKITEQYFTDVENILTRIQQLNTNHEWRVAVEFRNNGWYIKETEEMLDELDASMVLHDMLKSKNITANEGAPFIYLRFHGPAGDYRGSYNETFLLAKASEIKHWLNEGKDVYVYFNNTMGSALENSMFLKSLFPPNKNG